MRKRMLSENMQKNTCLLKTDRFGMEIFLPLIYLYLIQFPSRLFIFHFVILQETFKKKKKRYLAVIWKATIEGVRGQSAYYPEHPDA